MNKHVQPHPRMIMHIRARRLVRSNTQMHTHAHARPQNSIITTRQITPTTRDLLSHRRPSTSEAHHRRRPLATDRPSTGNW